VYGRAVSAFVTAGGGFLLAVLWFDLMFDVQVLAHRERELPDAVLASIAGYYHRVTTAARPMNRLITAVMIATVTALVIELAAGDVAAWVPSVSLALAAAPIALAGARIVPDAVRLGARVDPPERQSALARSIFHGHVLCAAGIAAMLAVQLGFA
jgi:hypothetical protein